jgi:2-polyprenyl-3-methyl-5-hydroxy-6-metoxy-1,4-benzoquinol methylase
MSASSQPDGKPSEWFEDEEFWRATFDQMFPPHRWEAAPEEVAQITALTGLASGRVLDLCCGPGRHSCAFARMGFAVTGVDRTPWLLELARQHADDRNLAIEFVEADMRDFDVGDGYDLVINLFTSFGYMADYEQNSRVLRRIRDCLRPGGQLVLDVRSRDGLARWFTPSTVAELVGGGYFIQARRVEENPHKLRTAWLYLRDGHYKEYELTHYLYSGAELRGLLEGAGFSSVKLFSDFAGTDYGVDSQRIVAVATKHDSAAGRVYSSPVRSAATHGVSDIVVGIVPTPATADAAVEAKLRDLSIAWCRFDYAGPVYESTGIDEVLGHAADAGHRLCAVQHPGHFMRRYRDRARGIDSNFLELSRQWCLEHDTLVVGDRARGCFIVDLERWRTAGRPDLAAELDKAPPFPELLESARCDFTDPARKAAFARYLGDGILSLDATKLADELPAVHVNLLRAIHDQAKYARQGVFLTNFEDYGELATSPEGFTGPVHTFLGPAAGFKPNFTLESCGFDERTRVCYFDYSDIALGFKRRMVENWDGTDFVDFLRGCADAFPQAFYQMWGGAGGLDYGLVDRSWRAELEQWGGAEAFRKHWARYRRLHHDYLVHDLFGDPQPLLSRIPSDPSAILWMSNAFHSLNACWFYDRQRRNEIYDRWIAKLGEINPGLWLYGTDVNNIDLGRTQVRDHLGRDATAI